MFPFPFAYSAKCLQTSPAGSKLGRTEGKQLSAPSLHTHTVQQGWLAGWSRAIIHTSKRCCCLWAPVSSGGSVPVLHHGSKLTGKAELLDKAGSRT